jgi:pentatricopeptide repeat protein
MFNHAHHLIENMANENCPPNTITSNTFIKGLCCSGKVERAMKVLDQMGKYGCSPNLQNIMNFWMVFSMQTEYKKLFG